MERERERESARESEREREIIFTRFVLVGSPMLGGVRIIRRVWRKTEEDFNPNLTFELWTLTFLRIQGILRVRAILEVRINIFERHR